MLPTALLVIINIVIITGLVLLSRTRCLGPLAGSLPNPLLHLAALLTIMLTDFVVGLYDLSNGNSLYLSNYRINDAEVFNGGFLFSAS